MAGGGELSMKLLIDNDAGKVLFAEAGKDVVDFILSFLALPVGSLVNLLSHQAIPGSIGHLHSSVEDFNENYIHSGGKRFLLNPKSPPFPIPYKIKKPFPVPEVLQTFSDHCTQLMYGSGSCTCYSQVKGKRCLCGFILRKPLVHNIDSSKDQYTGVEEAEGFVKEGSMYMIMDNLAVFPVLSAISTVALLTDFNIEDLRSLEQRTVCIRKEEWIEMFRLSLESKTVLSDVFLEVGRDGAKSNTTFSGEDIETLSASDASDFEYESSTTLNEDNFWMVLAIHKKSGKIVFAEAERDVIDFIFFSFDSLVGTMVKFLADPKSVSGCAANFYNSVKALNSDEVNYEAKHAGKPSEKKYI